MHPKGSDVLDHRLLFVGFKIGIEHQGCQLAFPADENPGAGIDCTGEVSYIGQPIQQQSVYISLLHTIDNFLQSLFIDRSIFHDHPPINLLMSNK
jgi:hypothetical protein